jgi:hypothetical protein
VALPPRLEEMLDSLSPREERRLPLDPGELERVDPRQLQQELGEALGGQAPAPLDQGTTGQLLDFLLAP